MNDLNVKKSKRIRMVSFVIGFVMMWLIGITLLSNGNTIYAEEVNKETDNHTVQHAAALTLGTNNDNQESISVHILAFGIVIIISGGTAGILLAIRKRNRMKKQNHFHNF